MSSIISNNLSFKSETNLSSNLLSIPHTHTPVQRGLPGGPGVCDARVDVGHGEDLRYRVAVVQDLRDTPGAEGQQGYHRE